MSFTLGAYYTHLGTIRNPWMRVVQIGTLGDECEVRRNGANWSDGLDGQTGSVWRAVLEGCGAGPRRGEYREKDG